MRKKAPAGRAVGSAAESSQAADLVSHLFVYGTLRRGGPMHALLEPGVRWVVAARMRGRLYDLGNFPGLAEGRSGDWVHGELYRIQSADLLDSLDRYEGRAYRRVVRDALPADGGTAVACWVYLFGGSLRGRRRIASGDYLAAQPAEVTRAARADRRA